LEVARFREELGDPEAAMRRIVESTFSPESLIATFAEMLLDARRIGAMNVVSLDVDLQRATTDIDVSTWLS
jgi:hypothetical protein